MRRCTQVQLKSILMYLLIACGPEFEVARDRGFLYVSIMLFGIIMEKK